MTKTDSIIKQHTLTTPFFVGEVHCYSAEINGELILFDAGPPTTNAFDALNAQIDLTQLKYLFLTHCHIDHFGLAAVIAKKTAARIFIPRLETIKLQRQKECLEYLLKILSDFGCDESITCQLRETHTNNHQLMQLHDHFEVLEESNVPAKLGIDWLSCPGHSQSDVVYMHGSDAISGDTLLHNIFQVPILDVDLQTFNGRFHNYNAYCESIKLLCRLQGYRIHPGHRKHIVNVRSCILAYVKTLLKRARQINNYSFEESELHIAKDLFGSIMHNPFFVHMKLSEIIFTRDFLKNPHKLKESLQFIALFDEISAEYHNVVKGE